MTIQHIERTVNPANERINKRLQSFQSGVISPHCSRRSYQDNCVSMSAFRVLLHASSCTYKATKKEKDKSFSWTWLWDDYSRHFIFAAVDATYAPKYILSPLSNFSRPRTRTWAASTCRIHLHPNEFQSLLVRFDAVAKNSPPVLLTLRDSFTSIKFRRISLKRIYYF